MSRNIFAAFSAMIVLGLSACGEDKAGNMEAKPAELVIVSWGGAYSASQQKAYHDPYMEKYPQVKIVNDDSSNEAVPKLRAMNEAGNVTWDLVDVVAADAIRACDDGLALEVDINDILAKAPDGTKASADFGDLLVSPCFIPQIVYSVTFGYRSDLVKEPMTGLCDVFDLAKFPGKRSLEKQPIYNVEWALLCDGVDADDIYDVLGKKEGVERALKKLDTIKSEIIWWSKGAETPQRLADGEVVVGSTYNGRLFSLIEEKKQPVAMLWDWQIFDLDGWIIPKGISDEKLEAVKHYLYFATDTQRLADQAKYISYGPARNSSAPLVGKHAELGIDMAPHMPTDPNNAKNVLLYNFDFWADKRDEIDEQFQAWLSR